MPKQLSSARIMSGSLPSTVPEQSKTVPKLCSIHTFAWNRMLENNGKGNGKIILNQHKLSQKDLTYFLVTK